MKRNGRSEDAFLVKIVRSLLFSAGIGIIFCAGFMAIASWAIVSLHHIPIAAIPVIILLIIALSSFLSGFLAAKMVGKRGLFIGLGSGALLCLIFLISVFCVNGYDNLGGVLTKIPVFLLASTLGGYVSSLKR